MTAEDPRLSHVPLPQGWTFDARDKAEYFQPFLNYETQEVTARDPRLTLNALRDRGVNLEEFDLI